MKARMLSDRIARRGRYEIDRAQDDLCRLVDECHEVEPLVSKLLEWAAADVYWRTVEESRRVPDYLCMAFHHMWEPAIGCRASDAAAELFDCIQDFVLTTCCGSCYAGDSAYRIEWCKGYVGDVPGKLSTVASTQRDPDSWPVVVRVRGDAMNSHRDPQLLVDTMNFYEQRLKNGNWILAK